MIKLKTLLMEADAPKLKDTEKEKAKKLGLVWKGKGYGKEGEQGVTHKNVDGKLVPVDKGIDPLVAVAMPALLTCAS